MSNDLIALELQQLSCDIGVRLAGSPEELTSANIIAGKFREYGAAAVDIETFPVMARQVKSESLAVELHGAWHDFALSTLGGSPGTGGKTLEAEAVVFYPEVDYQRDDLSYLRGKAVIHFGTNVAPHDNYRRLMEAEPEFIVFTDIRYPGDVPTADGLIPHYVRQFGAVPCVCTALYDVCRWIRNGVSRIRINIDGGSVSGESVNVIAEYPGSDPDAGVIITGSHIDSQAGSVGADDNAAGSVFQLALARELRHDKLRHTVRHIAFGAEEQLSVGSAAYVRRHWDEISTRGRFMINADSCGTFPGWNQVTYYTSAEVKDAFDAIMHKNGYYASASFTPIPFIDLLPFGACGVPGLWINRYNCSMGRYQHHRPIDTPEMISADVIAAHAKHAAELIRQIDRGDLVIPPLAREMKEAIAESWTEYFGG